MGRSNDTGPTGTGGRRGKAGWTAALVAAAGLAVCSFPAAAAAAAAPVRIGISLGLSGQYQQPASMQERAFELWRDQVNARGGILGRPVELVIRDDQGDPARAKEIYREFVTSGTIDQMFAPYSSQLTLAVAPIVDAGRLSHARRRRGLPTTSGERATGTSSAF